MEKKVTNLEDVTAPLNNGCSPPRLANYYTQCDVRRTAQSLLNKGTWLDSNEYHFLSHIDSLWTEYDDWQKNFEVFDLFKTDSNMPNPKHVTIEFLKKEFGG